MPQRRFPILFLMVSSLALGAAARPQQNAPSTVPTGELKKDSSTPQPEAPSGGKEKTQGHAAQAPATPDKTSTNVNSPAPPASSKPHKVLTNDDLKDMRHNDGFAGGSKDTHAIEGTGVCDDECADEARQMTEFGPDQDGEWRFALTAARRNLAQDTAWPGAYATLARAVKTYCTFQQQLQTTAVPSGNEYWSQVERARREKYAEDMSRVLGQNVTNANAQIERMAQQAGESEPARAAIMRVLAQHVNDSCDP